MNLCISKIAEEEIEILLKLLLEKANYRKAYVES